MNGDALIQVTRRVLRDYETDTDKGLFWSDREITLALNAAQDIYINDSIKTKKDHNLVGLISSTGFQASGPLPSDYIHYMSGKVGTSSPTRTARIYLGGEGIPYTYIKSDAIFINAGNINYLVAGVAGGGELYYFRRPSYIGASSLGDNLRSDWDQIDFDEWIYQDQFVNMASVILGMKEIQTQRDYKKMNRSLHRILETSPIDAYYVRDTETIGKPVKGL